MKEQFIDKKLRKSTHELINSINLILAEYEQKGLTLTLRQVYYQLVAREGCIGSLSELYDGNPPFIGRGAVSFAPNVGCILRVLRLFKNLHIIDK